jgi:glycosyltransferase involved in cell wall biosynthesis
MRILILTPWVPYPATSACTQDRFCGMQQMQSLGYEVSVLAKIHDYQPRQKIEDEFRRLRIPLTLVPHVRHPLRLALRRLGSIVCEPALIDGAALEYLDPQYLNALHEAMRRVRPDAVWVEYTTHWSLLPILRRYNVPIIMKSSLNEAQHCIDEHGTSLPSRIRVMAKRYGERKAAQGADILLAITPDEEQWYRSLGATVTGVLPLRGLSKCFELRTHERKEVLDVVLLSASFNVVHNRDAFLFLAEQIVPAVRRSLAGRIRFHVTGGKVPEQWKKYVADDLRFAGFVPDLGAFLQTMNAAVCPWISGQGMQQKVFEPLCRSLPLLTTKTGGYPFQIDKEVLLCRSPEEYVDGLRRLLDPAVRNALASAAYAKAHELFSEERMKQIMRNAIEEVILRRRAG